MPNKLFNIICLLTILQSAASPTVAQQHRSAIKSEASARRDFTLSLQTRDSAGSLLAKHLKFAGNETAIIVVDMWDRHWCKTFSQKTAALIPKMNDALAAARSLGMQVIFAPSDVTGFYMDSSQRKHAAESPKIAAKTIRQFDPPRPSWSYTGGCECSKDRPCQSEQVWTRQHPDLTISESDLISEDAQEIVSILKGKGVKTILYMGVASNMCVTVTRPFSVINMTRYGFDCVIVRDLVEAISGNGYNPDSKTQDPAFTPEKASGQVIAEVEQSIAPSISYEQLLIQARMPELIRSKLSGPSMFNPEVVKAYQPKGPTKSFRHLCYDYNWVGRTLNDIPKKFQLSDPVELAELSRKANMDAALILAVPHPGYTTYNSKYGERFPALKNDWFGEVVKELHKRNINAFGYITLGVHWKYMRDNVGMPFIHAEFKDDGTITHTGLCINAPGYLELLENYSRELLENYPLDALRYDMLYSAYRCECDGCHQLYKSLYGEELTTWKELDAKDSTIYEFFYLATLNNAANRLTKVCRAVKPDVEIWQNHINTYNEADVNLGRQYDVAYIESGDPAKLIAMRGIINKEAVIVGQTLDNPIRRLIMALGARCYQYIQVNQETALPDDRSWMLNDLSPFFKMVSEVQPYLKDATWPSTVALLYSENTRYHYPGFNRLLYMQSCEYITYNYLASSLPISYINALDLDQRKLDGYKVILLPGTSGLTMDQLAILKTYVSNGGAVVVTGDALLYDLKGKPLKDFALEKEMGIRFKRIYTFDKSVYAPVTLPTHSKVKKSSDFDISKLDSLMVDKFVEIEATHGETSLTAEVQGVKMPLVHRTHFGKGQFIYVASSDNDRIIRTAADHFTDKIPLHVADNNKKFILTRQEKNNRYVIHLIDSGDYEIRITKPFVKFNKITNKYPAHDWDAQITETKKEILISVKGAAKDRLLVVE